MTDLFSGIFSNIGEVIGVALGSVIALALVYILGYAILKALLFWICRLFVWALPDGSSAQKWFNDIVKKLD